jgi:RNA polymerase sigma-70 factor (ECF subfamily)
VLASLVANARAGRLRDPQAFVGYAKIVTRNKFVDRLKRELRHGGGQSLPWDEETSRAPAAWPESEASRALWSAVAELPEESRRIVEGVYREGLTYEEMSAATGIPLGTLKRRIGESLAFLRRRLAEETSDG